MEMEEEDFDVYGVDKTISDMGSTDSLMSEGSNSSEADKLWLLIQFRGRSKHTDNVIHG